MGTVVLVGTMDTKGTEYQYVKDCILRTGTEVITIDVGVLKESPADIDITSQMVAEAAGGKIEDLRYSREGNDTRAKALSIMQKGSELWLLRLIAQKKCDAVLGMGGSGGTSMLAATFQALPIGFPKILVSTMVAGDVKEIVGTTDMTLMYSVTDIAGVNTVSRKILGNAANAAAGMAKYKENLRSIEGENKPLIGITMFGVTTKGVLRVRKQLETKGFETIIFHCTGSGGKAMETMIEEGLIDGVIDYTVAELNGHLITKMNDAGEKRLTTASKKGIPQVVVPGALEVCNFPGISNLPDKYNVPERKVIEHNPLICAAKTSEEESIMLGKTLGQKLTLADKNKTALILPLKGIDSYEAEGGPWHDPCRDRCMFDAILSELDEEFCVEQIEANINDEIFADKVAEIFIDIWQRTSGGSDSL